MVKDRLENTLVSPTRKGLQAAVYCGSNKNSHRPATRRWQSVVLRADDLAQRLDESVDFFRGGIAAWRYAQRAVGKRPQRLVC